MTFSSRAPLFLTFTFLLLTFTLSSSQAQDFKAGIRAGICGSQVNGDMLSGFNKAGIIAGAFVNRAFSKQVTLQMEIVFIQKGSRKPLNDSDNTFYRMRLHYIEVPVLFQYYVKKNLALEAGPSFGTLIFSQEDNELGIIKGTPPFKKYEISFHAGVIYHLTENILVDARYSGSLTPVRPFQGSYNYNYFDRGQYNSVVEFSLLFQF